MASELFSKKRLAVIFITLAVCFGALLFRLSWLQLVKGEELSQEATDVRARDKIVEAKRGVIYDRNHVELVGNSPAKSIYVNPNIFSFKVSGNSGENKQESQRQEIEKEIADILGLKEDDTIKIFDSGKKYAWLKQNVDYDTYAKLENLIKEYKITGIGFNDGSIRTYPQGSLAAQVLGFMGVDRSARGGIERTYDQELSGIPGHVVAETDADGREIPQAESENVPPVPGKNLVLTIDQTIQYYVEKELDKVVQTYNPKSAVVIVMDPSNGEILAMGSRPTYNPARYGSYPQQLWNSNPALSFNYEPGSTFKMMVGAMALEEGKVSGDDQFYDPGYIMVSGKRINDWDLGNHGEVTFAWGVENSCNPVFISVGLRCGRDLMYKYIKGFGFGQKTGIDLPGEDLGLLIPEDKASELNVATMSIGQSIAVTPIQLVTAMSALANGGTLIKPHIVKAIEDPTTNKVTNIEPQVVRQVVSKGTAQTMDKLLQQVVSEGTGQKANIEGYAVAGKTGTAQVPGQHGYAEGKYIASFAGFVPADNPRLAVLVMIDEPQGGQYYGGEIAAPVFQSIASKALQYLNVPQNPNLPGLQNTENPPAQAVDNKVRIPNVIGFPVADAINFLEESGLHPAPSSMTGLVVEQSPAGGDQEIRGSPVTLKIGAGGAPGSARDVLVPDLTGLTIRRAGSLLQSLGLNFTSSGSGYVAAQTPRPGVRVAGGTLVAVQFSP